MPVVFQPGQELGRGDLDIFLTNVGGNPANAYTITYALYWVDPSSQAEVLVGGDARTPQNPAVGEYYAAVVIPPTATPGTYRIRWTFQELVSSPEQQVVQEFGVVSAGTNTGTTAGALSGCQAELVNRLRFLLRGRREGVPLVECGLQELQ